MQWRKMPSHILLPARKRDERGQPIKAEVLGDEHDDWGYVVEDRWYEVLGTAYDQWYEGAPGEKLAPLFVYLNDQGYASLTHVNLARQLRFDGAPRVLVTVEDGVAVACAEAGVDVMILDYDTDGAEDETQILVIEGEVCPATRSPVAAWNEDADDLWQAINGSPIARARLALTREERAALAEDATLDN